MRPWPFVLLVLGACGPSARPTDIPPVAPDFARGREPVEAFAVLGHGSSDDDDDDDDDDDEDPDAGFGPPAFDATSDEGSGSDAPTDEVHVDAS